MAQPNGADAIETVDLHFRTMHRPTGAAEDRSQNLKQSAGRELEPASLFDTFGGNGVLSQGIEK